MSTTPNRYPGNCDICGTPVPAGKGMLMKNMGRNIPLKVKRSISFQKKNAGRRAPVLYSVRCLTCNGTPAAIPQPAIEKPDIADSALVRENIDVGPAPSVYPLREAIR